MLLLGYCQGIRSGRRLCEEVHVNLAYRWFCRLDLTDPVPDVRRQGFWNHERPKLRESLAHLFDVIMRRVE